MPVEYPKKYWLYQDSIFFYLIVGPETDSKCLLYEPFQCQIIILGMYCIDSRSLYA